VKMMTFKEKTKQFDFLGAVLLLGAVFCLFLALEWGGEKYPWKSSQVVGLWIGFGLLFLAFCLSQALLGDKATIPPRILKQRTILYGALALSFISMSSNIVSLDWSYEPLAEAHNGTRSYTTFHSTSRPLKEYPYYKAVSDFWHWQLLRSLRLFLLVELLQELDITWVYQSTLPVIYADLSYFSSNHAPRSGHMLRWNRTAHHDKNSNTYSQMGGLYGSRRFWRRHVYEHAIYSYPSLTRRVRPQIPKFLAIY